MQHLFCYVRKRALCCRSGIFFVFNSKKSAKSSHARHNFHYQKIKIFQAPKMVKSVLTGPKQNNFVEFQRRHFSLAQATKKFFFFSFFLFQGDNQLFMRPCAQFKKHLFKMKFLYWGPITIWHILPFFSLKNHSTLQFLYRLINRFKC